MTTNLHTSCPTEAANLFAAARHAARGVLAAAVLLLTACDKGGDNVDPGVDPPAPPPAPAASLTISPETATIAFSSGATESYTFQVATNHSEWLSVSDQQWCKVEMDTKESTFTVTALPNDNLAAPTPATITVTAGKAAPVTIAATQAAAAYDVYLAGYYGVDASQRKPCYWKNGVRTDLPTGEIAFGECTALIVSGGSVYIAGQLNHSRYWSAACYWMDGERVDLPGGEDTYSIAVDNRSVCVLGDRSYWKDGVLVEVTDSEFRGKAIVCVDGSVHIAGLSNFPNDTKACYWNEGQVYLLELPEGTGTSYATCATVSGGSVYIGGYINTEERNGVPCYWKDGKFAELDVPGGYACEVQAICVENGKVYAAGNVYGESPCCWADGKFTQFEFQVDYLDQITGIVAANGNVFVSANTSDKDGYGICYWLNGKRTDLTREDGIDAFRAYGIGVMKK